MSRGEKKSTKTTLTSKGQVVISSEIREKLDLEPHQRFVERVKDDKIILEPLETPEELKGSLKELAEERTTEEIMREVKEGWE